MTQLKQLLPLSLMRNIDKGYRLVLSENKTFWLQRYKIKSVDSKDLCN